MPRQIIGDNPRIADKIGLNIGPVAMMPTEPVQQDDCIGPTAFHGSVQPVRRRRRRLLYFAQLAAATPTSASPSVSLLTISGG